MVLCQFFTVVLDPKITKSAISITEQGISKINKTKHFLYRNGIDIAVIWYYKNNTSVSFCIYEQPSYIYKYTRFDDKWYETLQTTN